MGLNKPGKRLQIRDIIKTPNTHKSNLNTFNQQMKANVRNSISKPTFGKPTTLFGTGKSGPHSAGFNDYKTKSESFQRWLHENAITTTTTTINSTATLTSISITNPRLTGAEDYMLRKGDTFFIYDCFSFSYKKLTCDSDLLKTDSTITITSTSFVKGTDVFRSGSFIIADQNLIVERTSLTPNFKRFSVNNASYRTLNTSPLTLLPAETGVLHLPLSCHIRYIHGGTDEMARANVFIGHNSGITTSGNFWSSIASLGYRATSSMLLEMGAGIEVTSGTNSWRHSYSLSSSNDGVGLAVKLYASAGLSSPTNSLDIYFYYKSIVI